MATNEIDDPEFWRFRAEEVRTIAHDMKMVEAKANVHIAASAHYSGCVFQLSRLLNWKQC
jgi:hypothetical protein